MKPQLKVNSPQARDLAYALHPYTNARAHEERGPIIIDRGEGIHVYDEQGNGIHRGARRTVERRRRLRRGAARRRRPPSRCASCSYYHSFSHKANKPSIDLAEKLVADDAGAARARVLRQFRLGGERHRRQDGLVLQQRDRPAAEEEDHLAHPRLSRHHRRLGQPDRAALEPPRLRPADRRHPAHGLPALLPLRPRRARARRSSRAASPVSSSSSSCRRAPTRSPPSSASR